MSTARTPSPAAALVGILSTVQPQGVWTGRRQLAVRFAGEAETAVMYSASALAEELGRLASHARFHSIALTGRDPLGNGDFLNVVLKEKAPPLPVMADTDGQRPEAVRQLISCLRMVQVTVGARPADDELARVGETLAAAAEHGVEHALVVVPDERATDAELMRVVRAAHAAGPDVAIVLHPDETGAGGSLAARWAAVLAQAAELHDDERIYRPLRPPVLPR